MVRLELRNSVVSGLNVEMPSIPPTGERVHEKDATVLVSVPGGLFNLGAEDLTAEDRPVHQVRLSPFWIAKYPVTNSQYRRFLEANPGYRKPAFWGEESFSSGNRPVVGVSWEDAVAYCNWSGLMLPTEAQWEAAARGTDGRRYPWGSEDPTPEHANFGALAGHTTPVGSYPAGTGPYGTLDMTGNVCEWCADVLDPDAYSKLRDRQTDPVVTSGEPLFRVLRGGSWLDPASHLPAALRSRYWARLRRRFIGFRCVLPATVEPRVTDAAP